uniref:Uncharacterized protein n=1 Tax=Hyaloperonospora arabidopsidis (strain Emoy2) TaxID=559515 RepID=M4BKK6_HYAAE
MYNLLSYCKLKEKRVALSYEEGRRYLKRTSGGARLFKVKKEDNLLVVSEKMEGLEG